VPQAAARHTVPKHQVPRLAKISTDFLPVWSGYFRCSDSSRHFDLKQSLGLLAERGDLIPMPARRDHRPKHCHPKNDGYQ
jgi:hypothetical protein